MSMEQPTLPAVMALDGSLITWKILGRIPPLHEVNIEAGAGGRGALIKAFVVTDNKIFVLPVRQSAPPQCHKGFVVMDT